MHECTWLWVSKYKKLYQLSKNLCSGNAQLRTKDPRTMNVWLKCWYIVYDFSPFEFPSTKSYPFFLIIKPKISALILSIHYFVTQK